MTTPSGPSGFAAAGRWGITGGGLGDSPAALVGRTREVVEDALKAQYIGDTVFASGDGLLAKVFHGLPDIPGAPLLVRVVAAIGGRLLGVDPVSLVPAGTPGEQMHAVLQLLQKVPILGDLIEAITGIEDGDLDDLGTKMLEIRTQIGKFAAALEGIPWESGDPGAILRAILSAGVQLVRGVIPEWMLPPTNIGRITGELPNLVANGGFDTAPLGTDGGPGRWRRNPDIGRTKAGCAELEGDGAAHRLSCRPVAVAPGQRYRPSGSVSCVGASGGASGRVLVREFAEGNTPIRTVVVGTVSLSGTKAWTVAVDDYTVPAGVQMVGLAVDVTEGFLGTARFDDVDGPSTGLLDMSWTKDLKQRWEQSAKLMGIVDTDLDGDVDLVDVWNTLWAGHLKPLGWVPTVAQDVIDGIYNGFANFGELLDLDRPRTDALDVIYNLLGIGVSNKTSLAAIEAEIRLLKSAGNTLAEQFEGAAGGLPSSSWGASPWRSWGGGSGSIVLDGKGNAVWSRSGGSTRGHAYRLYRSGSPAQITTDAFVASIVLASDPPDTGGDPAAYTYLLFSVPSSASPVTHGQIRFGRTKVAIESVSAGTVTTLIESVPTVNPRAGDTFSLYRGESGNTNMHTYVLTKNGVPVAWSGGGTSWTDPGSTIPYGSGKRGLGVGMQAGSRTVIPIILFDQWTPAGLGVVTLAEVL